MRELKLNAVQSILVFKEESYAIETQAPSGLIEVPVSMSDAVTSEDIFAEAKGLSSSISFSAGNTYRTIAAAAGSKKQLGINQKTLNLTYDFYDKYGLRIGHLIILISFDQLPQSPREADKVLTLIRNIVINIARNSKLFANFLDQLKAHLIKASWAHELLSHASLTFTATIFDREQCYIHLSEKEPGRGALVEKDAQHGYWITPTKIFYFKRILTGTRISSGDKSDLQVEFEEVTCPDPINALFQRLFRKSGDDFREFFKQSSFPNSRENLEIIFVFLQSKPHITSVFNIGKHKVLLVPPTGSSRELQPSSQSRLSDLFQSSDRGLISYYCRDVFQKGTSIQIQSQSELSVEIKEDKDAKEQSFKNPSARVISRQAEAFRQQVLEQWQRLPAKAWLLLISRLLPFMGKFESGSYEKDKLIDPLYLRLAEASLLNFRAIQKALSITQMNPEEVAQLPEADEEEVKRQWQAAEADAKHTLSWVQAFKKQNPEALIDFGGEVSIISFDPQKYSNELKTCQQIKFSAAAEKLLTRKLGLTFPSPRSVVLSHGRYETSYPVSYHHFDHVPAGSNPNNTRLMILFDSEEIKVSSDARATLLYRLRDKILTDECFEFLYGYHSEWMGSGTGPELLRDFFTKLLTGEPFSQLKASLVICITLEIQNKTVRFLIGVGHCMVYSMDQESKAITPHIDSVFKENGQPVFLSSLNEEPDDKSAIFKSYKRRHEALIQIDVVADQKKDLFFIPGSKLSFGKFKNKNFESEFKVVKYFCKTFEEVQLLREGTDYSPEPFARPRLFKLAHSLVKGYDIEEDNVFVHMLGLLDHDQQQQLKFIAEYLKSRDRSHFSYGFWPCFLRALIIFYIPKATYAINIGENGNPDVETIKTHLLELLGVGRSDVFPPRAQQQRAPSSSSDSFSPLYFYAAF